MYLYIVCPLIHACWFSCVAYISLLYVACLTYTLRVPFIHYMCCLYIVSIIYCFGPYTLRVPCILYTLIHVCCFIHHVAAYIYYTYSGFCLCHYTSCFPICAVYILILFIIYIYVRLIYRNLPSKFIADQVVV